MVVRWSEAALDRIKVCGLRGAAPCTVSKAVGVAIR